MPRNGNENTDQMKAWLVAMSRGSSGAADAFKVPSDDESTDDEEIIDESRPPKVDPTRHSGTREKGLTQSRLEDHIIQTQLPGQVASVAPDIGVSLPPHAEDGAAQQAQKEKPVPLNAQPAVVSDQRPDKPVEALKPVEPVSPEAQEADSTHDDQLGSKGPATEITSVPTDATTDVSSPDHEDETLKNARALLAAVGSSAGYSQTNASGKTSSTNQGQPLKTPIKPKKPDFSELPPPTPNDKKCDSIRAITDGNQAAAKLCEMAQQYIRKENEQKLDDLGYLASVYKQELTNLVQAFIENHSDYQPNADKKGGVAFKQMVRQLRRQTWCEDLLKQPTFIKLSYKALESSESATSETKGDDSSSFNLEPEDLFGANEASSSASPQEKSVKEDKPQDTTDKAQPTPTASKSEDKASTSTQKPSWKWRIGKMLLFGLVAAVVHPAVLTYALSVPSVAYYAPITSIPMVAQMALQMASGFFGFFALDALIAVKPAGQSSWLWRAVCALVWIGSVASGVYVFMHQEAFKVVVQWCVGAMFAGSSKLLYRAFRAPVSAEAVKPTKVGETAAVQQPPVANDPNVDAVPAWS